MDLVQELIIDNFAGGGGASTGIELAVGRPVDVAINHNPNAIAMHTVNHPETKHYCESVWDVDPREVTGGQPVGLCWLSPDCKHFSKAKGGKPREKAIRGLAFVGLRWAGTVKPRVIMLENVEEFQDWGPLQPDGMPDKKQIGRTFRSYVNAYKKLGYEVDWRELRACDYGAPTKRKRLFMIARCDGKPIVWPEPTHGDPKSIEVKKKKLLPWRIAAEIIDWSLPVKSIFDRAKPLSENTLRRIARGIEKFIVQSNEPFIIKCNHISEQFRGQSIHDPLQTITAKNGWAIVAPSLIQMGYGERKGQEPRALDIMNPLGTVTSGGNKFALTTSHLVKLYGTCTGQPVTDPLHTITAGGNKFGEVRAFLTIYNGTGVGQSVSDPLLTVTTHDRFGLVTIHGEQYEIADIGMRMLEPHELFAAQGFPKEYIIDRDADGNKFSKADQVARCGNSVSPVLPDALVRANMPEICKNVAYHAAHQLELSLV